MNKKIKDVFMMQLTSVPAWMALQQQADIHTASIAPLTESYNKRFLATSCGILLDYSNQGINEDILSLLFDLAKTRGLETKIHSLLEGGVVNLSEKRAALHSALRAPMASSIFVDDQDIMPSVVKVRESMRQISEQIRTQQWLGFTGEPITDIVNIGIGGSDLGPRFCVNALSDFMSKNIRLHFISDADPINFSSILNHLNPQTTLFIISSKSFTTEETLNNTKKAIVWLGGKFFIAKHMIAITAHPEKALDLGIKHVLPIWDWVGGRYSLCSAINLITAIGIGFDNFSQLLQGAHDMDKHFQFSDFSNNLPVLLALLGIWNNNFLHINNLLFLIYSKRLELFVPYMQQLDMESNGKSIDNQQRLVNYRTGPIVWGGLGNQAQHSYFQLLYQGTHKVTTDFISIKQHDGQLLNELCNLKMQLLARGNHIKDSMPLNHIQLASCSPYTIGALVALYEHKIFVQSVIWGINPFDQPGVIVTKRRIESPVMAD